MIAKELISTGEHTEERVDTGELDPRTSLSTHSASIPPPPNPPRYVLLTSERRTHTNGSQMMSLSYSGTSQRFEFHYDGCNTVIMHCKKVLGYLLSGFVCTF